MPPRPTLRAGHMCSGGSRKSSEHLAATVVATAGLPTQAVEGSRGQWAGGQVIVAPRAAGQAGWYYSQYTGWQAGGCAGSPLWAISTDTAPYMSCEEQQPSWWDAEPLQLGCNQAGLCPAFPLLPQGAGLGSCDCRLMHHVEASALWLEEFPSPPQHRFNEPHALGFAANKPGCGWR